MKNERSSRGSLLILYVMIIFLIVFPLVALIWTTSVLLLERSNLQPRVDAVALLAANDLSKIVIDDPNFGFVSLSNYPPVGKSTLAPDGEPLPVLGINTLVATIRQCELIARKTGSDTMLSLSDADHAKLIPLSQKLNQALAEAVRTDGSSTDFRGQRVQLVRDAKAASEKFICGDFRIKSVKISNGWLSSGGTSTIRTDEILPSRTDSKNHYDGNELPPFVDVKVKGSQLAFQFAGVGSTATLCKSENFQPADSKHICSIVRVDCIVERANPIDNFFSTMGLQVNSMSFSATAQPFSNPDSMTPGVLTLRCPVGLSACAKNWAELIDPQAFSAGGVRHYVASGGDYPIDNGASVSLDPDYPEHDDSNSSSSLAESLYYWLRNGHVKPTVGAVMEMLTRPFNSDGQNGYLVYEFGKNGEILTRTINQYPFTVGIVSDQQSLSFADTNLTGVGQCNLSIRNQVRKLGNSLGGKHAGQPLAGNPLDWCELPEFQGSPEIAKARNKGSAATNLRITGDCFCKQNGQRLVSQPRKSQYSGGLSVDIEITLKLGKF